MAETKSNIVAITSKRGGARAGAGRKPGSLTKRNGRFVYVVHEVDTPTVCKIGVANDPIKRLSAHQVSTWRRLKLHRVFTAPDANAALALEKLVHAALRGVHVSGEWFEVTADRAVAEIAIASDVSGIEICDFDRLDLKSGK